MAKGPKETITGSKAGNGRTKSGMMMFPSRCAVMRPAWQRSQGVRVAARSLNVAGAQPLRAKARIAILPAQGFCPSGDDDDADQQPDFRRDGATDERCRRRCPRRAA